MPLPREPAALPTLAALLGQEPSPRFAWRRATRCSTSSPPPWSRSLSTSWRASSSRASKLHGTAAVGLFEVDLDTCVPPQLRAGPKPWPGWRARTSWRQPLLPLLSRSWDRVCSGMLGTGVWGRAFESSDCSLQRARNPRAGPSLVPQAHLRLARRTCRMGHVMQLCSDAPQTGGIFAWYLI